MFYVWMTITWILAGYGALTVYYDVYEWRERRRAERTWAKHNKRLH